MGKPKKQGYKAKVVAVRNLLYALSYAPGNNERIYYYLLVDAHKEEAFCAALAGTEPFNIQDYATIIASGFGEPPEELKEEMRIKYNAVL